MVTWTQAQNAKTAEAELQAQIEREKFQKDLNTILIILTLIAICAVGAYFALHFSGRI